MKVNPELTIHDGFRDAAWRELLAATIGKYLAPDFDPAQGDVSALAVAREMGMDVAPNTPSLTKVDVYAPAAAAIHLQTQNWVTGSGAEARVRQKWLPRPENVVPNAQDPIYGFAALLRGSYANASFALETSGTSRLPYLMHRFDTLGEQDKGRNHATSSGSLRPGGTLPQELTNFTRVTALALQETPATTGFTEKQRVNAAHKLLTVSTSRAAQHLNVINGDDMSWFDVELLHPHIEVTEAQPRNNRMSEEEARAAGKVALYELLGPDNEALFLPAMTIIAAIDPILKCPAHQRIVGAESALQLQLHASINHMAEHGVFHPDFVIPRTH